MELWGTTLQMGLVVGCMSICRALFNVIGALICDFIVPFLLIEAKGLTSGGTTLAFMAHPHGAWTGFRGRLVVTVWAWFFFFLPENLLKLFSSSIPFYHIVIYFHPEH